jgi:hypothetical protein
VINLGVSGGTEDDKTRYRKILKAARIALKEEWSSKKFLHVIKKQIEELGDGEVERGNSKRREQDTGNGCTDQRGDVAE